MRPGLGPAAFADPVAGRRVVRSRAGGRLRRRETTRGPQATQGRQRSPGAGRAPKGLLVSVVDAEGKRAASFAPVSAATLQGPEAVVALWRPSWLRLALTQADQGLCLAAGAPWRGKRVPLLVRALGLTAERVQARLDCSHAVQRRGQVAALRKDWRAQARTRWRPRQRHWLLPGEGEQVIAAVRGLCRGRNSQAMRTHRAYWIKHQSRMVYAKLMAMKLPSGSGAIASTVRRVVNLRLKGPSLFWGRARAEALVLWRSYDKAGR